MKLTNKQKAYIKNNAVKFMGTAKKDDEYMNWMFGLSSDEKEMIEVFIKNLTVQKASILIKNIIDGRYGLVRAVFSQALNK